MIPTLTILTSATEAAATRTCLFAFQILGTGKGVICQEPAGTAVIDTACQAFEPIRYSRNDTEETKRQARGHNAAWDALCKRDDE
jgi:hypothetical protein